MLFLIMPVLWLGLVTLTDSKLNTDEMKQKYGEEYSVEYIEE